MSKRINVNPDHYKVGGREKLGNPIAKAPQPQAVNRQVKERWDKRQEDLKAASGRKSSSKSSSTRKKA